VLSRRLVLGVAAVTLVVGTCMAGLRGPGKYCGVAIFDRWGSCTLYSGIYLTYVSEAVKEQLRPHAGQCVQIDATKVDQPQNPGDALIREFTFLGPAPDLPEWQSPQGLRLTVRPTFERRQSASAIIRVENISEQPRTLYMNSLAPTLLRKKEPAKYWGPADGPSDAAITREAFWLDGPRMRGGNDTWQWTVTKPRTLPQSVALQPGESFEIAVKLKLPAGEYDLLAGYGGGVHEGQCGASNLLGFDVDGDGRASQIVTQPKSVAGGGDP
jgi:hypothetical protein